MTKQSQPLYISNTDENADWIKTDDSLNVAKEVYALSGQNEDEEQSNDDQSD